VLKAFPPFFWVGRREVSMCHYDALVLSPFRSVVSHSREPLGGSGRLIGYAASGETCDALLKEDRGARPFLPLDQTDSGTVPDQIIHSALVGPQT
jgi:hypothetical protein